jgi:hypothetical protein
LHILAFVLKFTTIVPPLAYGKIKRSFCFCRIVLDLILSRFASLMAVHFCAHFIGSILSLR